MIPNSAGREQPGHSAILVIPDRDDAVGWLRFWDAYRDLGRLAGRLDPEGPLYVPEYVGDHRLPPEVPHE